MQSLQVSHPPPLMTIVDWDLVPGSVKEAQGTHGGDGQLGDQEGSLNSVELLIHGTNHGWRL